MATADPIPLDIPAGFYRKTTDAASVGRYIDGYHVRFWQGRPEKYAGWTTYVPDETIGVVHGAMAWLTLSANGFLALGDYAKAYSVLDALDDITPVRDDGTLATDPFAVVSGETTVTVTHAAHGIDSEFGAYVIFSGATAGGGITVNGEYLATVVDANHYTIEHHTPASSTDSTTGGSSVGYTYLINNGLASSVHGLGVGAGPVGAGTVGTPRTAGGIRREMRTWHFDKYGELLAALPSGGTVYFWDEPSSDDRLEPVANAPESARGMFITAERMIVMLGTTTPMTMAWSDRDDPTEWTPDEATTANIRTLQTGNYLVAGTRFPGGGGQLFWSDTACYGMQFIDSTTYIYETPVLAADAGLIAPTAFETTRDLIVWLTSAMELFIYDGTVHVAPRWDEISAFVRSRIDAGKVDKTTFGHVREKNSIVCHYTSIDSADGENDEYFEVCLDDWSYVTGPIEEADKLVRRSAQVHFPSAGGAVVATGTDRKIYQCETGLNANGVPLPWSLRLGRSSIGNGAINVDVNGYIPDFQRQAGVIDMRIATFEWPNSQMPIDEQNYQVFPGDEVVDLILGGGYHEFEWGCGSLNCDVRFGVPLLDASPGSPRR